MGRQHVNFARKSAGHANLSTVNWMKIFNPKFALWFLVIVGFGIVIALMGYVLINPSHHTAWNPYALYIVLIPLFVIGLISSVVHRNKWPQLVPALLLILASLAGLVLILVLDKTNHLLQYEEWVRRGMP